MKLTLLRGATAPASPLVPSLSPSASLSTRVRDSVDCISTVLYAVKDELVLLISQLGKIEVILEFV
jgi:hypothetical protein